MRAGRVCAIRPTQPISECAAFEQLADQRERALCGRRVLDRVRDDAHDARVFIATEHVELGPKAPLERGALLGGSTGSQLEALDCHGARDSWLRTSRSVERQVADVDVSRRSMSNGLGCAKEQEDFVRLLKGPLGNQPHIAHSQKSVVARASASNGNRGTSRPPPAVLQGAAHETPAGRCNQCSADNPFTLLLLTVVTGD